MQPGCPFNMTNLDCGKKISGKSDLDHFTPWSRYPLDLGHNFVFAHAGCNNAKRDYLAAPIHIERWRVQNLDEGHRLARRFEEAGLLNDLVRSTLIARWAYQQGQASKAQLWVRKGGIRGLRLSLASGAGLARRTSHGSH